MHKSATSLPVAAAVVMNIMVIVAFVKNKSLQIPGSYLLLNLSVADLLVASVVYPTSVVAAFMVSSFTYVRLILISAVFLHAHCLGGAFEPMEWTTGWMTRCNHWFKDPS